jgi:hypothetical protein
MNRKLTAALLAFAIFTFAALLSQSAVAQTKVVPSLITQAVDETQLSTLHGNTYPLARAEFDKGAAPPDLPMARMMLVLKRSAEQQAALSALMNEQQDKSSPNYHKWLTPVEFGKQFGPSDQDIQTIVSWLGSHGFQIANVSNGRTIIEFSGTASQVKQAFRTEIHKFAVGGEEHWANSGDPQIPSALAPIVAGPLTLHNFPRKSMMQVVGPFTRNNATGKIRPDTATRFTFSSCGPNPSTPVDCFGVAPPDFARIYNVSPLYTANIDGTGQTIAIVAQSNIDLNDVASFRTLFGLPPNQPNVILNGADPGLQFGSETEADLDVEWAGAVAKGATIDVVVSESTETSLGADLSAQFIVDNNLAPVLNESFGICELGLGDAGNQFYNALWEQAAAQGISVFVSSGDSGSAGCSSQNAPPPSPDQFGIQVSGFASTPFNVAVGGTDFNQAGTTPANQASNFWNTTPSNTPTVASAKGYIPETTWNSSCTNGLFSMQNGGSTDPEVNCNNPAPHFAAFLDTVGGSGGPSNCTTSMNFDPTSCSGGYAKPTWQAGPGVPADGKRDIPDVSLFASSGFLLSFYIICEADFTSPASGPSCDPNDSNTEFVAVGGTSASSPSFAGIMAMVVQKTGSRQGNPNFVLYPLAAKAGNSCPSAANPASTCIFNDIPSGTTNAMPCASGSTPTCITKNAGDAIGILNGFATTAGYDEATGLGSVNAANLVNHWTDITSTLKGSITTFGLPNSSPVTITHGQSVNVTATVAPQTGTGTPSGSVALQTSNKQGVGAFTLSAGSVASSTANLPGGTYTVTAQYSGDGVFGPSTSGAVNVTVSPENSQTQQMVELFNPFTGQITNPNATNFTFGTPQLLRVNVASTSATASCAQNAAGSLGCPTGTIMLTDKGAPLDGGSFTLNVLGYTEDQLIDLPAGSHSIAASYSGDASFQPSAAAADNVTVTQAPTTVMVATMSPSIPSGATLTIQANVVTQSFGTFPTGTVTFFSGSNMLGAVAVTGGVNQTTFTSGATATFTTTLPNGQDSITAQYSGDNNYSQSAKSPAVVVTVGTPAGVNVSANPSTITISSPGSSGTTALTFTATGGFAGTINLSPSSCTGLPSGASCSFSPASVTLTGTTTTATANLSVATMAPSNVVPLLKAPPTTPAGLGGVSAFFMAMLILLSLKAASRKRWRTTFALLFLGSVAGLVACSGGSSKPTNPGTPTGTTPFKVTVSTGTGSSQTIQITLVVN